LPSSGARCATSSAASQHAARVPVYYVLRRRGLQQPGALRRRALRLPRPEYSDLLDMYCKTRRRLRREVKRRILIGTTAVARLLRRYYSRRRSCAADRRILRSVSQCDVIMGPTTPTTRSTSEKSRDPVQMYLSTFTRLRSISRFRHVHSAGFGANNIRRLQLIGNYSAKRKCSMRAPVPAVTGGISRCSRCAERSAMKWKPSSGLKPRATVDALEDFFGRPDRVRRGANTQAAKSISRCRRAAVLNRGASSVPSASVSQSRHDQSPFGFRAQELLLSRPAERLQISQYELPIVVAHARNRRRRSAEDRAPHARAPRGRCGKSLHETFTHDRNRPEPRGHTLLEIVSEPTCARLPNGCLRQGAARAGALDRHLRRNMQEGSFAAMPTFRCAVRQPLGSAAKSRI